MSAIEKKIIRELRNFNQNYRYIFPFTVNPNAFQFYFRKGRWALLENPTPVLHIFITDSDRTISTFQQQKEKKTHPFRNLLLFYSKL